VDRRELQAWIDAYERAWRTPGTEVLSELFTGDATYSTAPFEEPYRGLDAIRELWEREREGPGEAFSMTSEAVAVEGDTGVARLEVRYAKPPPRVYRDLWIVRLDGGGRCSSFEEWPFWPRDSEGAYAAGPGGG
jgi:SnoaL-like domain